MATLQSVNRGKPEPIAAKTSLSGIFKRPVSGPVEITRDGLAGDAVVDRKHHGGVDQALYIYFADDYAAWAVELDRPVPPGTFGENLTIDGIEGRQVAVGDRFTIGKVVLEVTAHRTPCAVFAARMGDPKWVRQFHRTGRPGAYCRVIVPGTAEAGTSVTYTPFAGERTTVADLMARLGKREVEPAFLRKGADRAAPPPDAH